MTKTKPIRDALRSVFYPHVLAAGFELDKRWQLEIVAFRRIGTEVVHVLEIQWDKYHRPKLVLNFSEVPLEGVDFGGKWMEATDVRAVHCGSYLRLVRNQGRFTYRWFQLHRPLLEQLVSPQRNYDPEEIASQVLNRFDEVKE